MGNTPFHPDVTAARRRLEEYCRRLGRTTPEDAGPYPDLLQELQTSLEEAHVAGEELRVQNEQLAVLGEEVSLARARYEALFEFAPDGYVTTDAEGAVREANRAAEALLGVRRDHLRGKPLAIFLAEEDRPAVRELVERPPAAGAAWRREVRVLPRGRPPFPALLHAAAEGGGGRPAALNWLFHDITDLKEAQERAVQAERLAALGQALAGLAHESRNALQRGHACLEMLALKVRDRPDALDLIRRVRDAQGRLHTLLEDARAYAAPVKLIRRRCRPAEAWREAWAALGPARRGRDAALAEEGGADLWCCADAFRLEQVFRNVFANALEAAPDPARVRVRCGEAELRGRPALEVVVRDNGPGLTPEQERRIFELFFTGKPQGTGLGMAIAKRLVEAHGGVIEAGNAEGGGAAVRLLLPRGEGDEPAAADRRG